jgi:hypothetical protein
VTVSLIAAPMAVSTLPSLSKSPGSLGLASAPIVCGARNGP